MGYPFDRNTQLVTNTDVATVSEIAQQLSNAALGEISIRFSNTIVTRN